MKNKPIIMLDEHPTWLSPLYSALGERGVPHRKLDISAASYDPDSENVYPFYVNRLSPSAEKRNHGGAFAYALNYIQYLEGRGVRVVNGSRAVLLETSKAYQSALLHTLHIPQPKTIVLNNLGQIKKSIASLQFPIVLKPNTGGSGFGIQKFYAQSELYAAIGNGSLYSSRDGLYVLQNFIQPKDGYVVRVETIAGKVIYAMKVFTGDIFNLCPSDSCDIERITKQPLSLGYCAASSGEEVRFELYPDIPDAIVTAVEKIMQAAGLECGGIEYVVNKHGDWFVYDINALSILRSSFKEEYGIDGWGMLADYLVTEYRKVIGA